MKALFKKCILIGVGFYVLILGGCKDAQTTKELKGFADKVCACKDAACAKGVEQEYLTWVKANQRARGSEGDRKDVEEAMARYSKCHLEIVGPEALPEPTTVPKVDLSPPDLSPPAQAPATEKLVPKATTEPEIPKATTEPEIPKPSHEEPSHEEPSHEEPSHEEP